MITIKLFVSTLHGHTFTPPKGFTSLFYEKDFFAWLMISLDLLSSLRNDIFFSFSSKHKIKVEEGNEILRNCFLLLC